MIPKIQTSAATLMTSGTVRKNPAMIRRRSHCIKPYPAEASRSRTSPTAMRYQANGANPDRRTRRETA